MTTPDIPRSEIANALEFRHACKAFDASRKIPDPDVELIVDAIRLAPSSYGFEPWNVIIAQSEDLGNAVKAFAGNNAARFDQPLPHLHRKDGLADHSQGRPHRPHLAGRPRP